MLNLNELLFSNNQNIQIHQDLYSNVENDAYTYHDFAATSYKPSSLTLMAFGHQSISKGDEF